MRGQKTPWINTMVKFDDPSSYTGTGVVTGRQVRPTDAVRIKVHTITDRTDQSMVGKETWIHADHVEQI